MTMYSLLSLETERLTLRPLDITDAEFIWRLMNDPDWIRYIGDRGVHDIASAKEYIVNGPQRMYRDYGFGILKVCTKDSGKEVGSCGLLQRASLQYPDIGFAFLSDARGKGYAKESCQAILNTVIQGQLFPGIEALVSPENTASIGLLTRMGFVFRCELPDFDKDKNTHAYRLDIASSQGA
jgi:[ribosomal protein S5]-alanine N-acetyltransferase